MKNKTASSTTAKLPCPLCQVEDSYPFHKDKRRHYWRCRHCALVFVSAGQRLDRDAEKAIYDLHENDPSDTGYRRFLSRISEPLGQWLDGNRKGLDFGCGPGPLLAAMMEEQGHRMSVYDHFYAADLSVFDVAYDFITATEVVEHLFDPAAELHRLWCCLKPGGVLAVMTKLVIDRQAFANWHYKNDPTHVCFFSRETFEWLAEELGGEVRFVDKDVIFLQKP